MNIEKSKELTSYMKKFNRIPDVSDYNDSSFEDMSKNIYKLLEVLLKNITDKGLYDRLYHILLQYNAPGISNLLAKGLGGTDFVLNYWLKTNCKEWLNMLQPKFQHKLYQEFSNVQEFQKIMIDNKLNYDYFVK